MSVGWSCADTTFIAVRAALERRRYSRVASSELEITRVGGTEYTRGHLGGKSL